MIYLLDTDVLSNLLKPAPSTALISRLAAVLPEDQITTSISLAELLYGARRVPARTAILLRQIEDLLSPNLTVLPFDQAAAHHYGSVRAELERRGTPIGDADVRIASIALASDLTVVTGNVRHFERVPGLRVENWLR